MQQLQHSPGQRVSIFLETLDGYSRFDGYQSPIVENILLPSLTYDSSYPQEMTKLSTGLYIFQFVLPSGSTAVGSYLVDVAYWNVDFSKRNVLYQVLVNAPYGNYSISI